MHAPRQDEIEQSEKGVRIGAAVAAGTIAGDPLIGRKYRLLHETALQSHAHATLADDFLERTHCKYFHDRRAACNKREPDTGCDAIDGFNRFHAILGASDECIAVSPSQMAVALVALGAQVETSLPNGGGRILPADAVHRLPGRTPQIDHQLRPGERITHFVLPRAAQYQTYRRVTDPASDDVTAVSVAIAFDLEMDHFMNIRIGLGGVAHKPWRAARAEEVLEGKAPSLDLFAQAADAELAEAKSFGHNEFKIPLARKLLLAGLGQMTRGPAGTPSLA
jgi:xanthine dehydrogenase YagS FAD-binding subunit